MNGVGSKYSVLCPPNLRNSKLFGGMSLENCRDIPEMPEKFESKTFSAQSVGTY